MSIKKEKKKIFQTNCGFSYLRYFEFLKEFGWKLARKQQIFKLHKVLYANPIWIRSIDEGRCFRFDLMFLAKYGHQRCYKYIKN